MNRTSSSREGFVKARHVRAPARFVAMFGRSAATRASSRRAKGSGASSSRRARLVAAPLLAVLALLALALSASTALAAQTHVFAGSFGSEGSGAGQLELAEHSGIAVDQTSHDVYVADTTNNRVEQRQKAPVQNPGPEQEDLQFSSEGIRSGCSPRW